MIVVVEDHPDTAQALARLLCKAGHDAVIKACAEELLEFLRDNRPQAIVLDLSMPGIGGMRCLEKMRSAPEWRDIPVIVYTADFNLDRLHDAQNLGVQGFLVKGTVSWTRVLEAIERAIQTHDA
jgi:CheY-like chemotaxis protein